MPEQDGRLLGIAFEAVRQCHQDVGRLIADLDGFMTKSGSTRFGKQDAVTWGGSRAAYANYWMSNRIYRLYVNEDGDPGVVEGINIRFFADDKSLNEPRLIIGRTRYAKKPTVDDAFDLDNGYVKWCNAQPEDSGKILSCDNDRKGIEKMCVVGLNLYSIQKLDDLTQRIFELRRQLPTISE